jgi:hypothetical protein
MLQKSGITSFCGNAELLCLWLLLHREYNLTAVWCVGMCPHIHLHAHTHTHTCSNSSCYFWQEFYPAVVVSNVLLFCLWLTWHSAYCSKEQVTAFEDNHTGWNLAFFVVLFEHQCFLNTAHVYTTARTSNKQLQWICFGWIKIVFQEEGSLEIKFII